MSLEKRNGTAPHGPEPETQPHHKAGAAEYIAGLRRRRAASRRLPVLDDGHADPWCYPPPQRGYEAAAAHLLAYGLTPAPNLDAMRRMWRCGGEARRIARAVAERWETAA